MSHSDESLSLEKYQVVLSGVCALIITVGLARFAYTPMLPIMNKEAGLSLLAGGWLATFNYIGYIMGALVAANLSDLRVKYNAYKICLVVSIVSTAAMGATTDLVIWSVLRAVSGITSVAGMLLSSGLVMNWLLRKGLRQELGLHFTGIGVGIVVSGVAIIAMADYFNWAQQWYWLATLGLAFFPPAYLWMPEPLKSRPSAEGQAKVIKSSSAWMKILIAFYFFTGFGYAIGATFIVAILSKFDFFAGMGSLVWIIVGCAAIPASFLWDKVAKSTSTIFALILANLLETVAIIIPRFTDDAVINIVGAALFGSTFVGIVSLTLALVGRKYPDNPAKAMAKLTISYGVAQIVAPAAAGYMAATYGGYSDCLVLTGIALSIGTFLLFLLRATKEQESAWALSRQPE
ncbi:YbfB/YjiJ family MFS transporter [Pseudomonas putida]|nr:YbfB/YjiJ family MFS transporter [Pseudomonas putida]